MPAYVGSVPHCFAAKTLRAAVRSAETPDASPRARAADRKEEVGERIDRGHRVDRTIWLAFGPGSRLAAEGARYELERMSRAATLVSIGLNLALGLAITAIKVAISH
jgi:hypothetical protein